MKKILVARLDFLGDMVCTTPLLRALKQKWPQAEIHVLANRYNRQVLDRNPDVSRVHTYVFSRQRSQNERSGRFASIVDRLALIHRLRRQRFDLAIVPNGAQHTSTIKFIRLLGIRDCRWHTKETGFDDRRPGDLAKVRLQHEALSGFALLPELGPVAASELRPVVYPDPAQVEAMRARLPAGQKPKAGMFVSNKAQERRWPLQRWQELADRLQPHYDVTLFRDRADPHSAEPAASAHCWLAPAGVDELIGAMRHLDLVISADSAPVHLASALRIPTVAMFEARPEKYQRWHPLGVPHAIVHAGPAIDTIGVEQMHAAVRSLLDAGAAAGNPLPAGAPAAALA